MDQKVAGLSCAKDLAGELMKPLDIDKPRQQWSKLGVK
jgi:hypothetical protein